jgi:hypothetical protein
MKRYFKKKYKADVIVVYSVKDQVFATEGRQEEYNAALLAEIALNEAKMPENIVARVHLKC